MLVPHGGSFLPHNNSHCMYDVKKVKATIKRTLVFSLRIGQKLMKKVFMLNILEIFIL